MFRQASPFPAPQRRIGFGLHLRGCHSHYAYLLGTAAVHISHFNFDTIRILDAFDAQGCNRSNSDFFVPVLIDNNTLLAALQQGGLNQDALGEKRRPPLLQLPPQTRLRALRGQHRIIAASLHLDAIDQWWPVKLYDSALPQELQNEIRNTCMNGQGLSDGDRFRQWCLNSGKPTGRAWLLGMSKKKVQNCDKLSRFYGGKLGHVFHELVPFAGLWLDFRAGALERILLAKCGRELTSYAKRILRTWQFILGDEVQPELLDAGTVSQLAHRYPRLSQNDAKLIKKLMSEQEIFPTVRNATARQAILNRILQCERIVTLESWFADAFLLRSSYEAIVSVFKLQSVEADSLFGTLRQKHYNGKASFSKQYVRLWLFALRFHPELSEHGLAVLLGTKGQKPPANWSSQAQFGAYARGLGFVSPELDRKKELCEANQLDSIHLEPERPELVNNTTDGTCDYRRGRPQNEDFESDRRSLFLEYVCMPLSCRPKKYITTFAVIRDIVHCYWGDLVAGAPSPQDSLHPPLTVHSTNCSSRAVAITSSGSPAPAMSMAGGDDASACHHDVATAHAEDYQALVGRTPSSIYSCPETTRELITPETEEVLLNAATSNGHNHEVSGARPVRYTATSGFPGGFDLVFSKSRMLQLSSQDSDRWTRTIAGTGNPFSSSDAGPSQDHSRALISYDDTRATSEPPQHQITTWPDVATIESSAADAMRKDAERPLPEDYKTSICELQRIWKDLDHTKIYVLSLFDVINLRKRQLQVGHYPQALGYVFRYDKIEKASFNRDMEAVAANGFSLQLITSPNAAEPGKCFNGTQEECSRVAFQNPVMWFFIATLNDDAQDAAQSAALCGAPRVRPRSTARRSSFDTIVPRSFKRKRSADNWQRVLKKRLSSGQEDSPIALEVDHQHQRKNTAASTDHMAVGAIHLGHRVSGFPDPAEFKSLARSTRVNDRTSGAGAPQSKVAARQVPIPQIKNKKRKHPEVGDRRRRDLKNHDGLHNS